MESSTVSGISKSIMAVAAFMALLGVVWGATVFASQAGASPALPVAGKVQSTGSYYSNRPLQGTPTPTACAGTPAWSDVTHTPVLKGRALGVNFASSLYLFGGRPDNTTYTQDVYRYDLTGGTWTHLAQQFPDLFSSNMGGGLLTFPEGQRVFIVGGSGAGSAVITRTLAFNPADGTFTPKAGWPISLPVLPGGWAVYNNKL